MGRSGKRFEPRQQHTLDQLSQLLSGTKSKRKRALPSSSSDDSSSSSSSNSEPVAKKKKKKKKCSKLSKEGRKREASDMKRLACILLGKCSMKMLSLMLQYAERRLTALHTNGWSEVGMWGALHLVARIHPKVHGSVVAADNYKALDRSVQESVKRVRDSKGEVKMKEIVGKLADVEVTDRDVISLAIENGFQVQWLDEARAPVAGSKKGPSKVPAKEEEEPKPPVRARAERTLEPRVSSESAATSVSGVSDQETDAQQVPEVSAPEVEDPTNSRGKPSWSSSPRRHNC